jgi:hypothetical protein
MSNRFFLTPCLLLAAGLAVAQPLSPANFRYRADLTGELQANTLYQVPLTAEFLRRSEAGLADVRLYDQSGREIPYAIVPHRLPPEAVPTCSLQVVAYDQAGSVAELTVKVPDTCPNVAEITLNVADRDFKKHVTVEASDDRKVWQPVAEDVIYDFTSQVDLRRTTLQFAPTEARYLRLTLRDTPPEGEGAAVTLSLRSDGLDLSYSRFRGRKLTIRGLHGKGVPDSRRQTLYDRQTFTGLTPSLDPAGNTVLILPAGLPADSLLLDVANPAYFRTVTVYASDTGAENSYRWLKSGRIHAFPGAGRDETQNRLELSAGVTPFYKIVIQNGDNPPLEVRAVTLEWVRRDLYFVTPAAGGGAMLCVGRPKAPRPVYDTGEFVHAGNWHLRPVTAADLGPVRHNDRYEPEATPADHARLERIGLILVVVTLMIVLGYWIVTLIRKGSGSPPAESTRE